MMLDRRRSFLPERAELVCVDVLHRLLNMNLGSNEVLGISRKGRTGRSERHFQTDHLLKDLYSRSFRGSVVTLGGQAS